MEKTSARSYSRELMLSIRETSLSRTRPSNLSEEFNNEDGLFSPDKWLQYRWKCEGVESRPMASGVSNRKKTSSRTEEVAGQHDLETIVLSPQRRGFFSGCRALSPKTTDDDKMVGKSRWRHGHLNNGVDFKPAFQKNALESNRGRTNNSSIWRNSGHTAERSWNDKSGRHNHNRGGNYEERPERIPEWVDEGPSSMTDIIELKGFDDDIKEKKKGRRRNRDSASKSGSHGNNAAATIDSITSVADDARHNNNHNFQRNLNSNSTQSSRPSSRLASVATHIPSHTEDDGTTENNVVKAMDGVAKEIVDVTAATVDKPNGSRSGSALDNFMTAGGDAAKMDDLAKTNAMISLPNSDAEFAAFLGILDVDPASIQKDAAALQTNQPSSSRLSRFFCRSSPSQSVQSDHKPFFNSFNPAQLQTAQRPIMGGNSGLVHNGPSVLELAKGGGGSMNKNESNGFASKDNFPSALKELFSAVPPRVHTPSTTSDINEGMTVQELERDLTSKMQSNERLHMPTPHFPHQHPLFHPNAAQNTAAKLAAMQAMAAPPNDQFLAAFQQQLHEHFQRMAAAEAVRMDGMGDGKMGGVLPPPKFPFDFHQQQQQLHRHQEGGVPQNISPVNSAMGRRTPNINAAPFMPTSVIRQMSKPPSGGSLINNRFDKSGENFPSALKELFSTVPPRAHTPTTPTDFNEGLTVQDLERDLAVKLHANDHPPMPMPHFPLQHPPFYPNAPLAHATAAKLAAVQAMAAPPNDQFLATFQQQLQRHFQIMANAEAAGGFPGAGMEGSGPGAPLSPKFPFDFHQQQQHHHHFDEGVAALPQNLSSMHHAMGGRRTPNINAAPFMPATRQMPKGPAGANSINSANFVADQQQLNLAIMRGDLTAAQSIRARMIAQVQTLAGLHPFQD